MIADVLITAPDEKSIFKSQLSASDTGHSPQCLVEGIYSIFLGSLSGISSVTSLQYPAGKTRENKYA